MNEDNRMNDLISREGVLNILQYFNSTQWLRLIKILPSAEAGLIAKIQNGIKATDADDAYSCGMRNGMRWCMSLIDDKEPLYETCPYLVDDGFYNGYPNDDDFCSRGERRTK